MSTERPGFAICVMAGIAVAAIVVALLIMSVLGIQSMAP
jgi:hypothetical protein